MNKIMVFFMLYYDIHNIIRIGCSCRESDLENVSKHNIIKTKDIFFKIKNKLSGKYLNE